MRRIVRTQVRTLLVIFVALAVTLMVINQAFHLRGINVSKLPPARSETPIRIQTGLKNQPTPSGDPSTDLVLDGTLRGYDLAKLAGTLDKPCPQWHTPFLEAGWSEDEWATARWIIYRESRCKADAFNGHDAGLLQINRVHRSLVESYGLRFPEDLFDGETNLWVAYTLWQLYGWKPWTFRGVVPGGQ